MHIVCLAWGSLIWKPGALHVAGPWRPGGPVLPIEFARVGDSHELATVISDGVAPWSVWWARLHETDLDAARDTLRIREAIPESRPDAVGSLRLDEGRTSGGPHDEAIRHWAAEASGVQAVVWTALPPRFDAAEGRKPSPAEAVGYLAGLVGEPRAHAEDYIRQVPADLRTPNRLAIESALGWRPRS